MVRAIDFWILAGGLLLAIFVLLEVGRRIGIHRRRVDPEHSSSGLGALEGAVFGLMGLLIAFTFSGAATRFDGRREMIGREANAIGTAYLRIDLLPAAAQPALRQDFRDYLDLRLKIFRVISKDYQAALKDFADSNDLQTKIWNASVAASQQQSSPAVTTLVLSSTNEMIDIATTRLVAQQTHPPEVVFYGLGLLVLATSLLAGYGMAGSKKRSFIHMTVYAVIMAATLYVILDLEYPRFGLIRIDSADQVLVSLRDSMK
jgi:hypothetical protein